MNACDVAEVCAGGTVTCPADALKNCADAFSCTTDNCTQATGACTHTPDNTQCNDNTSCTTDTCNTGTGAAVTGCLFTAVLSNCDDANACTSDFCTSGTSGTPAGSGCSHTNVASGGACSDNSVCTVTDLCNGSGSCTPGSQLPCADAFSCTSDTCDALNGCIHTPVVANCNDNNPCTTDACLTSGGATGTGCKFTGGQCTLGQTCVTNSDCASGNCAAGAPKTCGPVLLVSLAVTPTGPLNLPRYTLANGTIKTTQQFVATATFSDNSTSVVTTSATWTSGTTATATIGPNTGLATANTAYGSTLITASYTTGGLTRTASQTLNIVCPVLINEVQMGTVASANDEWIELYNNIGASVNYNGYSLHTSSRGGFTLTTVYTFGAAEAIASASYQVYANKGHTTGGTATASWTPASGNYLTTLGGAVALLDAGGVQCDAVGWSSGSTPQWYEGTLLTTGVPANDGGFYFAYRHPNAADANNNAADFLMSSTVANETFSAANP